MRRKPGHRYPHWKVYDAEANYQAACHEPEAAACLVAFYGPGATVRYNHRFLVWEEPAAEAEARSAAESYDDAASAMRAMLDAQVGG